MNKIRSYFISSISVCISWPVSRICSVIAVCVASKHYKLCGALWVGHTVATEKTGSQLHAMRFSPSEIQEIQKFCIKTSTADSVDVRKAPRIRLIAEKYPSQLPHLLNRWWGFVNNRKSMKSHMLAFNFPLGVIVSDNVAQPFIALLYQFLHFGQ